MAPKRKATQAAHAPTGRDAGQAGPSGQTFDVHVYQRHAFLQYLLANGFVQEDVARGTLCRILNAAEGGEPDQGPDLAHGGAECVVDLALSGQRRATHHTEGL